MSCTSFQRPFGARRLGVTLAALALAAPILASAQAQHEFRRPVKTLTVTGSPSTPTNPTDPTPSGGTPALSLSTQAVDFGNVATNTTAKAQVLVSNTGDGTLSITRAATVSGAAEFAAGLTTCGSTLAAGADCLLEPTFSPTTTGTFNGVLTFTTALAGSPHDITLVGTAFNPVSLATTTLPKALLNKLYTPFNFSTLLAVSNEVSPVLSSVTWSSTGTLPAGMQFDSSTGSLGGTPTALSEGASFTVKATYKNNEGQQVYTIVVGQATLDVVALGLGQSHACGVTPGGALYCWGDNSNGKLGNGTTVASSIPVAVPSLSSGVRSVAATWQSTCAVLTSGAVKCWGSNISGQLGDGTTTSSPVPVQVVGLTSGVVDVSLGEQHACVLTTDGGAQCWGDNTYGQLGQGDLVRRTTPTSVPGLSSGVRQVSAGRWAHSCATLNDDTVRCWGNNAYGQLGDGTTVQKTSPVVVSGLSAAEVLPGSSHTCARTTSGGVKCWGRHNFGQVGVGSGSPSYSSPANVVGLSSGVTQLATNSNGSCALVSGVVKCWGLGTGGQLGNNAFANSSTPVNVVGLASDVTKLVFGNNTTCVLTTSEGAKCWGMNNFGQLGDGTATNRSVPVSIQAP